MGNPFKPKNRVQGEEQVSASVGEAALALDGTAKPNARSKRGRRIMTVVLVFLILLLLVATAFLLWLVRPRGEIARGADAGGVTWIRSIYGWGELTNEQLVNPAALDIASNGDIIVPNTGEDAVRGIVFDSAGVYKRVFWGSGEGALAFPSALSIAPDGRMFVVQGPRDEILVLNRAGTKTEKIIKVQSPTSIDVGQDRMVIGSSAGFVVTDLDGTPIVGPIGTRGSAKDSFDVVGGVALDKANNVFVVDSYNNRISKYDASGKRLWIKDTGVPANRRENKGGMAVSAGDKYGDYPLQLPAGCTFDAAGRLLVVDPLDSSIAAVDPDDGTVVGKWGKHGSTDGQFTYPSAIQYDATRDWIAVADLSNNRVQIVRLPGTGGSRMAGVARSLTGPLRACIVPFLLLIIALIAWSIYSWRKRRVAEREKEVSSSQDSVEI